MLKKKQTINQYIRTLCPILCIILGLPSPLVAQNNGSESPYTRFGLGNFERVGHAYNRGMGGLGIALRGGQGTNPTNPASYSAVDSMTFVFDFGASAGAYWSKENRHSSHRLLGNFEYATMLFPISKGIGASIGLLPMATAGYQYGSSQPIEGSNNLTYKQIHQGTGNLSKLYIGAAIEPFEGLSVGANLNYMFGSYDHSRHVSYSSGETLDPTIKSRLHLQGIGGNLGLQYSRPIAKGDQRITIGATYTIPTKFNSKLYTDHYVVSSGKVMEFTQTDTIKGNNLYSTPHVFALGVSVDISQKVMAGIDVQYSKWSEASFYQSQCKYQDQWFVALGTQYIPNANDVSMLKQIRYRAGISMGNSYLKLPTANGFEGYHRVGLSAGLSIPLVDRRSFVQMGLEYDRLLPNNRDMVSEHSIRLTLGLTFNEGWFRKLKLN